LLYLSGHTDDQAANIARWALRQARHNWPHGISRLDVLEHAALMAQMDDTGYTFASNGNEYTPAQVLAMLGRGEDPRPREAQ